MGFFESIFYTVWRGLAIGILISAPMGPVGILCIQRTLLKGRKTGFYTGIGAAISDLFYCILTGFGLSFIEEFLERNKNIIQLAGSVVLIAFAIYLFKKNPASALKTPQEEAEQIIPHKNILGGFLFTFSNPLILFLIIGLFARFNFSIPEISFYYYIAGYVAIFFGCVLWWYFVTYLVNKLRAHFNLRSMWLINRIIGVIILLFAIVGIVTGVSNMASAETIHFNKGRTYSPFKYATEDGLLIHNQDDTLKYDFVRLNSPARDFSLKFRARNCNGDPAKKYKYITQSRKELKVADPQWGFFVFGEKDTLVVNVKAIEKANAIETQRALEFSAVSLTDGKSCSKVVIDNINAYSGDNLFNMVATPGMVALTGGDVKQSPILEFPGISEITGYGFYAGWAGKILISDIEVNIQDDENKSLLTSDILDFDDYFSRSKDPMEGYWMVFDRELEENLLKLGGNYRLACIKQGDCYHFHYVSGAEVNSKNWSHGDLKAVFTPTPFDGIYDVAWYDSMKEPLLNNVQAQEGEGNTITVQFPYQSSKLRLRKLPSAASSTAARAASAESASNSASAAESSAA